MSPIGIAVLGAVAGFTIFLGLPIARLDSPSVKLRALLNATATGILVFLLWDVLSHAVEPIEGALTAAAVAHHGSWARFAGLSAVFAGCLTVGLLGLVVYDRWMGSRVRRRTAPVDGPGAMALRKPVTMRAAATAESARLSVLIAVGIGAHNLSEGLAIGQSAAKGELTLATLLIIGFGLHNATEGFGITAPLAAARTRPSWGFLGVLGLIGGGPTLVGTLIGQSFVNDGLSVAFLALAAGSILYVTVQLLGVGMKIAGKELLYGGLLVGLLLGFATDFIVTAAGA